jgi:hypothetical protein
MIVVVPRPHSKLEDSRYHGKNIGAARDCPQIPGLGTGDLSGDWLDDGFFGSVSKLERCSDELELMGCRSQRLIRLSHILSNPCDFCGGGEDDDGEQVVSICI